jgi:hypothetical protein
MEKKRIRHVKDIDLIKKISLDGDEESLCELHLRYKNMYYKQAHKFNNFFAMNNIELEDILKDSLYVVYDSAKTFDEDRGIKYITWLGSKTKFYFLNMSNRKDKSYCLLDFKDNEKELEELSNKDHSGKRTLPITYKEVITVLKNCSDERIPKIFEHRYHPDNRKTPSWRSISEKFKLSSQTIINLHTKGLNYVRKKMKNLS